MWACLVLALSLGLVSGHDHWSYPETLASGWDGLCATGAAQSPIDLDPAMVASIHAPITYKHYFNGHFNKHHTGLLKNDGKSVSWYPNHNSIHKVMGGNKWALKCPSIRDGPYAGVTFSHSFYLWKLSFHWGTVGEADKGSEHTIGGEAFPLEMQMVHIEDKFIGKDGTVDLEKAAKDPYGIAVLSVLFKVDNKKAQNMQPLKKVDDDVWEFHHHVKSHQEQERSAEELEDEEIEHYHDLNMRSLHYGMNELLEASKERHSVAAMGETKLKLNVGAFIRKATRNGRDKTMSTYWTYKGSLTTPGCNEAVTWVVFQRTLAIAQVQANAFASLYPDNFRAPKPVTMAHNVQYLLHKPVNKKA